MKRLYFKILDNRGLVPGFMIRDYLDIMVKWRVDCVRRIVEERYDDDDVAKCYLETIEAYYLFFYLQRLCKNEELKNAGEVIEDIQYTFKGYIESRYGGGQYVLDDKK